MPPWLYEYGRVLGSALLLGVAALLFGAALLPSYYALVYVYAHFGAEATVVAVPFAFILWGLCYMAEVIVIKWLTFSRFKPGTYSFASPTAARWAFIGLLVELAHWIFVRFLIGSEFICIWYRLLGAKIGRRVTINTTIIADWDLLEIDDDVFIGGRATVICHVGESNMLKLQKVRIGKKCSLGQESAVFPGCTMEDKSVLGASSLLTKNTTVPAGEVWGGVPAAKIK